MLQKLDRRGTPPRPQRWTVLLVLATAVAVVGLRGAPAVTAEAAHPVQSAGATATSIAELPERTAVTSPPSAGGPYVVTSLVAVSRSPLTFVGFDERSLGQDANWPTFRNTQIELIKSDLVLQAALRDPNVASLPLIRAEADPVSWLRRRLVVGFGSDSEIMAVQMYGTEGEVDQLKQLVDAVVSAYLNEVASSQRQRMLDQRDAVAKALARLNDDLSRKSEAAHDLAIELGSAAHSGVGEVQLQISLKRLDRIETELMKLENEQLAAQLEVDDTGDASTAMKTKLKFYEQRIAQLRNRQDELEQQIRTSSETSVDLQQRLHQVEQLQRVADDMTVRLEAMDIERDGTPERIRLIQAAAASRSDESTAAQVPSK